MVLLLLSPLSLSRFSPSCLFAFWVLSREVEITVALNMGENHETERTEDVEMGKCKKREKAESEGEGRR